MEPLLKKPTNVGDDTFDLSIYAGQDQWSQQNHTNTKCDHILENKPRYHT